MLNTTIIDMNIDFVFIILISLLTVSFLGFIFSCIVMHKLNIKGEMINEINVQAKRDIKISIKIDWEMRYREMDKLTVTKMMLNFWKSPRKVIDPKALSPSKDPDAKKQKTVTYRCKGAQQNHKLKSCHKNQNLKK